MLEEIRAAGPERLRLVAVFTFTPPLLAFGLFPNGNSFTSQNSIAAISSGRGSMLATGATVILANGTQSQVSWQ